MTKKEVVIDTARELFSKYGYKKVSMDEIATNANVTKNTMYTYFKDKEDMFKFFIQEELDKMKVKVKKQEEKDLPFLEIVSSNIYSMLKFRKKSLLFSSIMRESKDFQNNKFLKLYDDEMLNYIESKIKKEIELKHIKDCDAHLTAFIICKVYMAVVFEYDEELNEKKVTKEITSILKDGLFN